MKIYIAAHKPFKLASEICKEGSCYVPIQVGAAGKKPLGFLRDDEGENISLKNPNYCELTGLYWIWKNSKEAVTGLVHYRRYFTEAFLSNSPKHILSEAVISEYLKDNDIILAKKEYLKETAWEEYYMVSGYEKDLISVKDIITKTTPEYIPAFDSYFNGNTSHLYNMLICKKALLDDYCSWLFPILKKLEKTVDFTDYNDYQKRIYGFLSERLLNVWVLNKKLRIKEVRTINTEQPVKERIRIFLRRYKNRMIFARRKQV